jgi:hypothetical protein
LAARVIAAVGHHDDVMVKIIKKKITKYMFL